MNIADKIKDQFELVNKVYFEKEDNFNFLRVEVNLSNLEKVTALSREINKFVDENDNSEEEFYLDIFSSGTEKEIDKNNLQEQKGQNVLVKLNKHIKEKDSFEGELLEAENESITIRWNAKGQFRKQLINIEDIEKINLSSKIKKEKK